MQDSGHVHVSALYINAGMQDSGHVHVSALYINVDMYAPSHAVFPVSLNPLLICGICVIYFCYRII